MSSYAYDETYIRRLIQVDNLSMTEVFENLKRREGSSKPYGLSYGSLKRFCQREGISRSGGSTSGRCYKYDESAIRQMVEDFGMTHKQVIAELTKLTNGVQVYGLSERSLIRFCADNGITARSGLSDKKLDGLVSDAVEAVGPSYGHRMLRGYLLSRGNVRVISKHRVRDSLVRVDPIGAAARLVNAQKKFNPQRYHAPFFGYNLHVDQNEKLVDFGIVYVAAIDGHSSFIFDVAVMPRKNNVTIYRDMFKPIVDQYGLFYKVHADGGKEFYLTLFMQDHYWKVVDPERTTASYRQTKSTLNNRIERYWSENNERISYYMKDALILLERAGIIDVDVPHHKFSVSQVGMYVAKYGATIAANAWNCHHIENRGKPIELIRTNDGTVPIPEEYVLDAEAAVDLYQLHSEDQRGRGTGLLTDESPVGTDLLGANVVAIEQRDRVFHDQVIAQFGGLSYIFGRMVNNVYGPFQNVVANHIRLSESIYGSLSLQSTVMTSNETVKIIMDGEYTKIRLDEMYADNIKTHFRIPLGDRIYLRNSTDMQETVFQNRETGKFCVITGGTYHVVWVVSSDSGNISNSGGTSIGQQSVVLGGPPIATGVVPTRQLGMTLRSQQQQQQRNLTLPFNPAQVVPLGGNNMAVVGDIGPRNTVRRRLQYPEGEKTSLPQLYTIYFQLAKQVSNKAISETFVNGFGTVGVSFTDEELKSVKIMNEKTTTTIRNHAQLGVISAALGYVIWGPSKTKMLDCVEMQNEGMRYWMAQFKGKATKYYAVPDVDDNEFGEDSDEEGPPTKKGRVSSTFDEGKLCRAVKALSRGNEAISTQIKEIAVTMAKNREDKEKSNKKKEKIRSFLETMRRVFECTYCNEISINPVLCGHCSRFVACKSCADAELETEDTDRVKYKGDWSCPRCYGRSYSDNAHAYKAVELDLSILKDLSEGDGESSFNSDQ